MHADNGKGSPAAVNGSTRQHLKPRVVILDAGDQAQVEVLELPATTVVGGDFSHGGKTWRITGLRPASRVFIARPAAGRR